MQLEKQNADSAVLSRTIIGPNDQSRKAFEQFLKDELGKFEQIPVPQVPNDEILKKMSEKGNNSDPTDWEILKELVKELKSTRRDLQNLVQLITRHANGLAPVERVPVIDDNFEVEAKKVEDHVAIAEINYQRVEIPYGRRLSFQQDMEKNNVRVNWVIQR